MKIGIIGTGGMAKARMGVLLDTATVAWVCSRDLSKAAAFLESLAGTEGLSESNARALNEVEPRNTWEDALDGVNGVVVCTPNGVHYPVVKTCLEKGKHVLLEYPPTVKSEEGTELIDLAKKYNLVLHTGMTHHFSAMHQQLKDLLDSATSDLGRPWAYNQYVCTGNPISRWYNRDELSGGMLIASLYHYIDEAMAYLGAVDDVAAFYEASRNDEGIITRDCGTVVLTFVGRSVGTIVYCRGFPKPGLGNRRTVICDNGYLEISGGTIRKLTPAGDTVFEPSGGSTILLDTQAFIDEVRDGDTTNELTTKAVASLRIAEKALLSL